MEDQTPKKILIVDDDQAFVKALATFLSGHGYKVFIAQDATFAIKYVAKENIDLAILDLGLPSGGGFFVLENIRKTRKIVQMRIIVSTANITAGVEKKSRELGADDFILKPYDLEKLLEIIKIQLA
ncbi:MAG: response regulator transcription factor [Candidatus Omnitrophica bacterium]|nr:response regulator transcription factor [Candidatus Omnitrophota bacterium]